MPREFLKSPGGSVRIDRSNQEAWVKDGGGWAPLPSLTPTEFQFLELFLKQPGRVLQRSLILDYVREGSGSDVQPGTVDKHVESLRRKLGPLKKAIRTVYGAGYAFRD